jgi:ribose-phosphate pyrophosphokinase
MKLDLTNPTANRIENLLYKVSKFPDGQQSLEIPNSEHDKIRHGTSNVTIVSRLNNFSDLELIICGVKAIRGLNKTMKIDLSVPYFIGARSDRKFVEGGINYVKDVISPVINSLDFDRVKVLDPHSDVIEACVNGLKKATNTYYQFINFAVSKISGSTFNPDELCLISPDSGAYKKTFDVAKALGVQSIATANKIRDIKTGQIIKTEVPNLPISKTDVPLKYVIIDDICDGGRTFIELAKAIREQLPTAQIYLVVTHGIFSAGLDVLTPHFNKIITTNSYKDIEADEIITHQFNVFTNFLI